LFGSCIIYILYTECAKIEKNNSGAKRLSRGISVLLCKVSQSDRQTQTNRQTDRQTGRQAGRQAGRNMYWAL